MTYHLPCTQEPGVGGIMRHTSPPLLKILSELGASGRSPQHCHEELQARVRMMFRPMDVMRFKCPMLSLKRVMGKQMRINANHWIVLPFNFFAELFQNAPTEFARSFLGGGDATIADASRLLRGFWANVADDDPRKIRIAEENLKRPDVNAVDEIWERAIPISIHGDAFPLARTYEM